MFSVFRKTPQTPAGCMLIKCHSDSGHAQLITEELCYHYENSLYAQTHIQDIHTSQANLCIAHWKGTFQSFCNRCKSRLLLVDKSIPIVDHEMPAICNSLLCNAICLNPDFFFQTIR